MRGLVGYRQALGVRLLDLLVALVQKDDDLSVAVAHQRGNVATPQPFEVGFLLGGRLV